MYFSGQIWLRRVGKSNNQSQTWSMGFTFLSFFQSHLETVVPAPDRSVLVLMGKHRGEEAVLKSLDVEKFCAKLKLVETGEKISLPYEHFSKLHSAWNIIHQIKLFLYGMHYLIRMCEYICRWKKFKQMPNDTCVMTWFQLKGLWKGPNPKPQIASKIHCSN